jgi:DNA-binding IclR family transcriptional regulator
MAQNPSRQDSTDSTIESVNNAMEIIETIMDLGGAGGTTEIANSVGMAKSSVHKHLTTLREQDFVTKEGDRYCLGLRFLNVGTFVRDQYMGAPFIKQKMREVALKTNEIAFFHVVENGRSTILFRESGQESVPTRSRVGMQLHLHQAAAGKAILSEYPEEEVRAVVDQHGLPAATPETITDLDELMSDLERTRERGYGLVSGESTEGLQAVGVPITLPNGDVFGGCSVGGPIHRMEGKKSREEIPEILHSVANQIELTITHSR